MHVTRVSHRAACSCTWLAPRAPYKLSTLKTASYAYDAAGRLAEKILPNGIKATYHYDED
jgi:YD repeat-containing protein